ncbi:hypothetical protein COV49_01785 [Candidatus Falkowbacteria bacterium CG11_big_fil_rev_8_21_14_0_20_39_10]|uniref:Uncharacterized protein n=1 Tax=Candidatus Falkowbacteria bacterium CG11_big_fil_rev_8_21_14_0_20_39_10 TaxID=1974570 RepID=A0A2M6K9L3_9BACT|nr:MAG: hypothetical protein COV49_01785 [Candidatus Falkowbacteria bacterium CG11_big_fil_rev_8_21_14_0_20_39_10]
MTKRFLLVVLVGVFFVAGNVIAGNNDGFPVKEMRVGIKGDKSTEVVLFAPTESGQFTFFPITEGENKPLAMRIIGDGDDEVLVSYLFQVANLSCQERFIYCIESASAMEEFSCSVCGKLEGKSVVDFFFGDFRYAEAKIAGETIKITFFRPEETENTRENKHRRRVTLAGL